MKKIIVAEDDKFLSNAYRLKLTKAGYTVTLVQNGRELLDKLESNLPDLILLDLVMPVMDGFAALDVIKSTPRYKKIPIIVASNLGQKEDVDRTKGLGVSDFVIKSDLSMTELIEKIVKLIG